jgi:CobQ-like glutamine amidotransferase family enzyme
VKELHIVHLYPDEMNTYGDRGNLLTLVKRSTWHGYKPVVHYQHIGQKLPEVVDIMLGGGGQDSAQGVIQDDLQRLSPGLHALAGKGTPMLMVCGCYQLFGHTFVTHDDQTIRGIGIFNVNTRGGQERMMGNVIIETEACGTLTGFENHSGLTELLDDQQPLGRIVQGKGNNGQDGTEGARTNNVFGTYMHGPLLPANSVFADLLISLAATERYGTFISGTIDDTLAHRVHTNALRRPY